ncbi:(2R)-3-sulfolactate dehydrogenase (NADP+) [Palleronia salina]|uniref:(2R)-3-sulfolactate dehydrogenase (NADP+) n=1 Tax=Palleronia salina TaxID=313368 RepID=A0A1M6LS95_9RHOB|nr:Ldh family oxidoreductase [Palleronia salina]SHJ74080.1 (2R)-3-sulfolactate dehydrogenase (NADP+) [Palleronia salina]
MPDPIRLGLAEATDLLTQVFAACGCTPAAAVSVASALVAAEAEGQSGHGFSRVADYAAQARSGKVVADATPVLERADGTALTVDAGFGFAYPALDLALTALVEAANTHGTASVAIRNSHHCGALSVQVEKIAQAGLVGLMVANAPAAIAPWGARTPIFGTNPIAFAAPRAVGAAPLVIDLSLSKVARGKVMHARKSGQPIPEGWAFDSDGNPTTDPEAALAGTMAPIGGAKGTALALMVEVLAATLTGANASREAGSFFTADGERPGTGQFLLALRPGDPGGFADRLESLLTDIAAQEGARLPGTRRATAIARAEAEGIDVPAAYVDEARALASSHG